MHPRSAFGEPRFNLERRRYRNADDVQPAIDIDVRASRESSILWRRTVGVMFMPVNSRCAQRCATVIFSAVNPILFARLPYPRAEQIVRVLEMRRDDTRNDGTCAM